LLRAGRAGDALVFVREQQQVWASDIRFHTLAAEAHQALGHASQANLEQAEAYVLQGRIGAAIEQLQLAQRHRNSDFYTQSIIDARLRELKARQSAKPGNGAVDGAAKLW
jgi:predicted Zn-dependent protease